MDVGSIDLHSANNFIQILKIGKSFKIGCLEEIALNNKWISKQNILNRIKLNSNSYYSNYLKKLIHLYSSNINKKFYKCSNKPKEK